MSTAQRVSRGFHRLALVLAAVTLLYFASLLVGGWLDPNFHSYDFSVLALFALACAGGVYVLVRAIGWVIGGFIPS
jgi:hypothetical protein